MGYRAATALTALLSLAVATPAAGVEADVTARYREGSGGFINTTPPAQFCTRWPQHCAGLYTVNIPVSYQKRVENRAADLRDRYYIGVPSRRTLTLRDASGASHTASLEITGVSQKVKTPSPYDWNPVWGGDPGGGCTRLQSYWAISGEALYLWRINNPPAPTPCHADSDGAPGDTLEVSSTELAIGFRLVLPEPVRMTQGVYKGSVSYSIGPGREFDIGNGTRDLSDSLVVLNIEVDVAHPFRVDLPAGAERVLLEPTGGWSQWLSGGRRPSRLYRDVPFKLWSGGPFSVAARCPQTRCVLRNGNGHEVPLNIALTLPAAISHDNGAVRGLPLDRTPVRLASYAPVLNQPGQLRFEVLPEHVEAMTDQPGTTFATDVTLVFEAEL